MSRLTELERRFPLPGWRGPAWLVAALIAIAIGWGAYAELEEVAVADGEVVPQGQVKLIQHLEGGIIRNLHVDEGRTVKAGTPLVDLDLGAGGINAEELQVQIDGLRLRRARLMAEAEGSTLVFPEDVAARRPELVKVETETHERRRQQFESAIAVLENQARQRELEAGELAARRNSVNRDLGLAERRLAMSADLLKQDLVPKMEHLQLESEVGRLRGQRSELQSTIPKVRAAIDEARERKREARLRFRRAAIEDLGQTELALARNLELLAKATDQARRTLVKSPIDGVVTNMRFHTIGGVVGPGDVMMEIVPVSPRLEVEAKVKPTDVGYVARGQKAVVKISTYDFVRYGALEGEVIRVAPDSTLDRDGRPFFQVVVRTDRSYLGDTPGALPITPGMQATVDIRTGSRSVLAYLISPVLKLQNEAFRER